MLSHCFKYRKDTERKNPEIASTKNGRIMLLSNCVACDNKKLTFVKQQKTSWLLSSLGTETPLNKISLLGLLLL